MLSCANAVRKTCKQIVIQREIINNPRHIYYCGLLDDDTEWIKALTDAHKIKFASGSRRLFITIVKDCPVHDVVGLFEKTKHLLIDDYIFAETENLKKEMFKSDIDQRSIEERIGMEMITKMYNSAKYEICVGLDRYHVTKCPDFIKEGLEIPKRCQYNKDLALTLSLIFKSFAHFLIRCLRQPINSISERFKFPPLSI